MLKHCFCLTIISFVYCRVFNFPETNIDTTVTGLVIVRSTITTYGATLTIVSGVKTTDVTDVANPLVHFFLSVSHQVKDTVDGLNVENEAVLQILLAKRQPSINLG